MGAGFSSDVVANLSSGWIFTAGESEFISAHLCSAVMLAAADMNSDGMVTSLDALMILQAAAGAIEL